MNYLHRQLNIIHRDLKGENIFLEDAKIFRKKRLNAVIGDFGHVKDLEGGSSSSRSNQAFGTNNYLAPEAYDRLRRSNKIDIWSFGCIVYELFNLEKLFNIRNPTKLRTSINNFKVDTDLNPGKIKPLYVEVVKRYFLLFLFLTVKKLLIVNNYSFTI
jgi:serine/threonine protein kinase